MDVQFFRELHQQEFATKDALSQRATTIITVMTTLSGALAFVVINYKSAGVPFDLVFWALGAGSLASLFVSAGSLVYSYRVPALNQIGKASEWLDYWKEVKATYDKGEGLQSSAEQEFTNYLIQQYSEVAESNIKSNTDRGDRLVLSNNAMLMAFVFLVLTALSFYYNDYLSPTAMTRKSEKEALGSATSFTCYPTEQLTDAKTPKPRPVPGRNKEPQPNPFK